LALRKKNVSKNEITEIKLLQDVFNLAMENAEEC
jgi:hypothetical protein